MPYHLYGSLYLCGKYFDIKGLNEKANKAYFYFLCGLVNENFEDDVLYFIEDKFENIKDFIFNDWLAIHPKVTFLIGNYYLHKNNHAKAKEYFELGALIDYDGRQSYEPFLEVGKNRYELGKIVLQDAKSQKDYQDAFETFEKAADDLGEPCLPIMGDMYYEGLGVEKNLEAAIRCYEDFNYYNLDIKLYFKELNEVQQNRLKSYLEQVDLDNASCDELDQMIYGYYRLGDVEKKEEIKKRKQELVLSTPED